MNKPQKRQKRLLFDPVVIAKSMQQKIYRDFSTASQMYGAGEASQSMLIDRSQNEFLKKFTWGPTQHLEEITYSKFENVNEHMASFDDLTIEGLDVRRSQRSHRTLALYRAQWLMRSMLGDIGIEEWFQECRHSGGVSVGVPFRDTSVEAKFTYPISVTARAKTICNQYFAWDSCLAQAVEVFNDSHGHFGPKYEIVDGSRATTVPKTAKINRMIAVEPTGNMFLQQGLMAVLYKRLKAVGLDLATLPDTHKDLAREASISGRMATIDFSSASDCVSTGLLRFLLPPRWFRYLDTIRCTEVTINGEIVPLKMFSTMGNADTFPLETLVFWTLSQAVLSIHQDPLAISYIMPKGMRSLTSVFGDDCIVPTEIAEDFMSLCTSVGFIVNDKKSHYDKHDTFRESCGGDYLQGYPVRPYSLTAPTSNKASSALEPWLYKVLNGMLPMYIQCMGANRYLYSNSLLDYVFLLFKEHNLLVRVVPPNYPDDSGLRISEDLLRLVACYPEVKMSKVTYSKWGLYKFSFLRFKYREARRTSEDIHYYEWLKNPFTSTWYEPDRPFEPWVDTKRVGGYVVAVGVTSGWTLPYRRTFRATLTR